MIEPATADPMETTYTRAEIAKILKVSEQTVSALIRRGQLPILRLGKRLTRVRRSELLAYMEPSTTSASDGMGGGQKS